MTQKNERRIIGIDFGATTTLVSHQYTNPPSVINLDDKNNRQPLETVMRLIKPIDEVENLWDLQVDVNSLVEHSGADAWIEREMYIDTTYYNFKNKIGSNDQDDKKALIWLNLIYDKISKNFGGANLSCYDFVFGVPAGWDSNRRKRFEYIVKKSGYKNVYFVSEPVAAILSSNFHDIAIEMEEDKYVLFFDFGGQTLDLSLIRVNNRGVLEFIHTGGNPDLGGRSFDSCVVESVMKEANNKVKAIDSKTLNILAKDAIESKSDFAKNDSIEFTIENSIFTYSKKTFEDSCNELIQGKEGIKGSLDNFFDKLKEKKTSLDKNNISDIIKVGGASKWYFIDSLLKEYFGSDVKINELMSFTETQLAVVRGLPLYLTKTNDILTKIKPKIRSDFDQIKQNLYSHIDAYVNNVSTDFAQLFQQFEQEYRDVLKLTTLAYATKIEELRRLTQLLFENSSDKYLSRIESETKQAYEKLNILLDEAIVLKQDELRILPDNQNYSTPLNKIQFRFPGNFINYFLFRDCIILILGFMFRYRIIRRGIPAYSIFPLTMVELKMITKFHYRRFFSLKEAVPNRQDWRKEGGFFYQVKKKNVLTSWDDFWKEFEIRFRI